MGGRRDLRRVLLAARDLAGTSDIDQLKVLAAPHADRGALARAAALPDFSKVCFPPMEPQPPEQASPRAAAARAAFSLGRPRRRPSGDALADAYLRRAAAHGAGRAAVGARRRLRARRRARREEARETRRAGVVGDRVVAEPGGRRGPRPRACGLRQCRGVGLQRRAGARARRASESAANRCDGHSLTLRKFTLANPFPKEPGDASVSPPPTSESPAPCAAMADEKEPESEGGWGIAETVGWLLVGEPEADVAPPPKHQIVQANRAIGALLKDKDSLSEDLKSAQKLVETKDAEVAEMRLELERREAAGVFA